MMTGLKERVEGAMGVRSMQGTEGATMAPPTARLYPVDPLGVLMIKPSPCTVVTGCPSTSKPILPSPGCCPLSITHSFRQE